MVGRVKYMQDSLQKVYMIWIVSMILCPVHSRFGMPTLLLVKLLAKVSIVDGRN